MLRTALAALFGCLLFAAPALAAPSCPTWEGAVLSAAASAYDHDDRVSAILLTEEETATTMAVIIGERPVAAIRLGIVIAQSAPSNAFFAIFGPDGCLIDSGFAPLGGLIDAMVAADVESEFVIIEPRKKDIGA